ncbi:RimJ/RimL family protein N-acetyltransferase [Scopulibacillus darangshiensis]|uniref:RimJ/RimL family protein N-acetyltransferase n=1 Tax=Scopulibacillus darangshiensis TaxID=442528 RepID=A0A4R2P679_9BACL|nr:GNAT family protein [Scopulibacillus darangshiensis]TCP29728.1 RimJ/RimL family protein N-acetyltransferase [Scopulibacillus darangshiensis]
MLIEGKMIGLRQLENSDAEALLDLELRNRDFFKLYTSSRDEDFYTLKGQMDRINNKNKERECDSGCSFGIFALDTGDLIGDITLSEVVRGAIQGCFIGYTLDKGHNGKGYMTEAVRLVVLYAFDALKLHRIEAGVMPHNQRSMRVLEKAGFHKEGIAKKNVKINGRWEDHQVLAIVNEND